MHAKAFPKGLINLRVAFIPPTLVGSWVMQNVTNVSILLLEYRHTWYYSSIA